MSRYINETQDEYTERLSVYKEFMGFWDSIPLTWHEHHEPQKKFMFDFLFRLIVSCWPDYTENEKLAIQSEAQSYLKCSQDDLAHIINHWRRALPHFSVDENSRRVESAENVKLLQELIACDDVCTEYTFDEGVSFTPFDISYPPEFAFQLLKHMGYEKGMKFKTK